MKIFMVSIFLFISLSGCSDSPGQQIKYSQKLIELAITFDDGPNMQPAMIDNIVNVLARHKTPPVYWFINGSSLYPDGDISETAKSELIKWVESGHILGSHGFTHMSVNLMEPTDLEIDLEKNDQILSFMSEQVRRMNYQIYRYPSLIEGDGGNKSSDFRELLHEKKYKIGRVSINVVDWEWAQAYDRCVEKNDSFAIEYLKDEFVGYSMQILRSRIILASELSGTEIKHIFMLHMTDFVSVVLDDLLYTLESKGVDFIALPEALEDQIYKRYEDVILPKGSGILQKIYFSRKKSKDPVELSLEYIPPFPVFLDTICRSNKTINKDGGHL